MSKTISKVGGTCRNIQGPGGVVFGEFFQDIIMAKIESMNVKTLTPRLFWRENLDF